jgi:putative DNA primase/helicase
MSQAGQRARAGQEVRLVDIAADIHQYGTFECLHGFQNGALFSQFLTQICKKYYGTPAREFLKQLVQNRDVAIQSAKSFIDDFVKTIVPPGADGQVLRVARMIAQVGAAGELATSFGITGWPKAIAMNAAKHCFEEWVKSRGGLGPREVHDILSQVMLYFQQHGESHFTPWNAGPEYKTIQRAGFRKQSLDGGTEYFVFPEVFRLEISKGYNPAQVAKICAQNGLLHLGHNGESTRSELLPGDQKKKRCYRFTSKACGWEG